MQSQKASYQLEECYGPVSSLKHIKTKFITKKDFFFFFFLVKGKTIKETKELNKEQDNAWPHQPQQGQFQQKQLFPPEDFPKR